MTPAQAGACAALEQGDWRKAHLLVQDDESSLGCWLHGIVHILEGDMSNARYWYRRAQRSFPPRADAQTELRALRSARA